MSILDRRNYVEVNGERGVGHTTGIREPLLLSDISIARILYWPGIDEGRHLVSKYNNFIDFKEALIDDDGMFYHKGVGHDMSSEHGVNSDFVVAFALLENDVCSYGEDYVSVANPRFLGRVVKGIVNFYMARRNDEERKTELESFRRILPESVHHMFEPFLEEADWIDYTKFR